MTQRLPTQWVASENYQIGSFELFINQVLVSQNGGRDVIQTGALVSTLASLRDFGVSENGYRCRVSTITTKTLLDNIEA